jgi:hypothetical protein
VSASPTSCVGDVCTTVTEVGTLGGYTTYQVRKKSSWPRSWANCSLL